MKELMNKLNPKLLSFLLKFGRWLPFINEKLNGAVKKEYGSILGALEPTLKPYRNKFTSYEIIPEFGLPREQILRDMRELHKMEASKWSTGKVSGAVYHGNESHIDFLNEVYSLNSQSNPLHVDIWPSASKYEAEIVSMTAHVLGADEAYDKDNRKENICGSVSSGGTESILLAMKTYRDKALVEKGIRNPEIIAAVTVHAAFDKASQYFQIKLKKIPLDSNYQMDVKKTEQAISRNTIAIIGSAPCFPHGIIDPIEELSELAFNNNIGFHTDACLGGFLLPWLKKQGYKVPQFDFSLRGVTSMSADTHKYGYAAKGTSVVLYRSPNLRKFQYFTIADWPGGLYFSPTFAGSRPGALSAACWAAMISIGESGYMENAKKIVETAQRIKNHLRELDDIYIIGDPLWVIAFGSEKLDIYKIMEQMTHKGWSLNGLHRPPCVHLCVTLRHTQEGVAETFIDDLKEAIEHVKKNPQEKGQMAPMYGMAATMPDQTVISDMLEMYIDLIYKV